jgi:peptidoglycan/xylan/chitin deacetylase (PgdA/CDA1 family)
MRDDSRGTVVVSVDAELGWGYHDLQSPPARLDAARDGWLELLALCDRYDVPTTWAFVGHLLLEDCDGWHSDHPLSPEWFARERGTWADRRDLRFGPDLVTAVRDANVDHELACHSFSHVIFDEAEVSRTVAAAEIRACQRLAAERDVTLSSFVFPRNAIAHRDVLADHGFACYRGTSPTVGSSLPLERQLSKVLGGMTRPPVPPLVDATVDEHGLVDVPASLYLFGFQGIARRVVDTVRGDPIVRSVRRGLDAVAGTDRILHLWLHPNDLRTVADVNRLRRVLDLLRDRTDAGGVRVQTMGEIADRVREQHSVEPGRH